MAENENFSANIEVNLDVNTTAAEAKIKKLNDEVKRLDEVINKRNRAIVLSESEKAPRPKGLGADAKMSSGKHLEVLAAGLGEQFNAAADALFRGVKSGIDKLDKLAEEIDNAGYRLQISARTGQLDLVPKNTPKQQQSKYLTSMKFNGAEDAILSPSNLLGGIDAVKLRRQIIKELNNLGFTGLSKYIVGQVKAATEAEFDGAVQLEGIDGMAWAEDISQLNAQFINENAKRLAKFIGAQFATGQDFLETGMATQLQGSEPIALTKKNGGFKPGVITPNQIQASSDFTSGPNGVPVISAEIFALAAELAMQSIQKADIADFGIAEAERKKLLSKANKAIWGQLRGVWEDQTDSAQGAIDIAMGEMYQPSDPVSSKRPRTPKVSPAEQNQRLLQQLQILLPNVEIDNEFMQKYYEWIINTKIIPALESIAHKSVKKMAQGNSRYNELLNAGDAGSENFQEYQQRAIQSALPELSSRYGISAEALGQNASSWQNQFIGNMVKIAAVSGEVAAAMQPISEEFLQSDDHLRNFNKYLDALIEENLTSSQMSRRELGRAAKVANQGTAAQADNASNADTVQQVKIELVDANGKPIPTVDVKIPEGLNLINQRVELVENKVDQAVQADNGAQQQTAEAVVDQQLKALREAYNGDKMQQLKKIMGQEIFDKLFVFLADTIKNGGKFSDVIAGWDTEFSSKLNGVASTILESSIVLRNAQGEIVDLQTFMHRPAYLDPASGIGGLAGANQKLKLDDPNSGIGSIAAFMKRAKELGIPESELGNLKDLAANTAEASKKALALQAIFIALDNLNIPLSGQNIVAADFEQFKKTMEWLSKFTDQIHLTTGLGNVADNLMIMRKMQGMQPISGDAGFGITGTGKGTKLDQTSVIQSLFKQFPEVMAQFSNYIQPTKGGFKVTIDNKEFKAHTAQADAIASIIVNQVMRIISPTFASLMGGGLEAYAKPGSPFLGAQSPYSANTLKNTKVKIDPQQRALEANAIVAATREEDAAQRDLMKTMSSFGIVIPLFQQIRAIISGTAGNSEEANNALKPLLRSMASLIETQKANLSGKRLNSDQKAELARLNELQIAFNALHDVTKEKGNKVVENKKELFKVMRLISGEYDAEIRKQEELNKLQQPEKKNYGKQYRDMSDAAFEAFTPAQAGPVFGKEIQAQMKGYIAQEKQVESANKNLINTWVTARYALYDVANAYQNVSRNLIMATRQMFNMTQSYRNFETAFTPVERAMSLFPDEVAGLRNEFVKLSEEIPVAFQDLASVATLGAQMGIGAGGIKEFTKTVTEFAAVTGVSADTVAQKFGRIAQLTKLDSADFEKLGSAISYAGVNAVATEAEIMSLSEAIAAVSNKAGMSSAEVVGLSTSLASLGIAPEQARGVFTRVFADIDRAVAKGETQLENFSKTAGMSAADFKAQWGTDKSYEVFRRVLEGINKSGKNMTNTFDKLNLTETREVNTLTRLATNLDVVDSSMQNANSSFGAGTFLNSSFAKTVDNLDSKIKIFKNRIDSLTATLSKGFVGTLSSLLEIGSKVADMLKILADNSIIQFLTSATAGALALGGIGAGLTSVMAKVIAQIYAFRVASINSANDPTAVTGWGRQLKALTNYKNEIIEMRDQIQKSETSSNIRGQITPVNYKMSTRKADYNKYLLEEANIYRATGVNAVKAATQQEAANILKKKSAFDALILARQEADSINHIVAVRQAEIISLETKIAAQVAEGRITNAQAVAIMSEARARQIHYQWINGEVVALSLETELQAIGVGVSDRVTKKKQAEALARMENAAAINAETRAGAVGKGGILEGPGATMMKLAGGALTAITAFTTIYSIVELIRGSLEEASKFNLMESGGGLASLREAISKDTAEYEKTGKAIRTVTNAVEGQADAIDNSKVKIGELVGVQTDLNSGIATGTDNVKAQTLAIGENTKAWIANALIQNEKLQEVIKNQPTLLDDLKASGTDFKQVISDITSGKDVQPGLQAKLQDVNNALTAETQKDFSDIKVVRNLERQKAGLQSLIGISGELSTALKGATTQSQVSSAILQALGMEDPSAIIDQGKKTVQVVLKTLSDYAGDVGGVFDKMLKYKFEKRNAFADLQGVVDGVEKGIKDAHKALRDLNNSLTENSKKKKRLEMSYQLAVQFGDTERAKEIANEIASVDAEISTNQEDIAYNQEKLAGSLDLTTQAGRDNNETLQGMITSNSQYIQALIDSGASQATINKAIADGEASFRQQAAAMGISADAVDEYAKAFKGFKSILKGIPKKVNVDANTDPAKRALEEFKKLANGTTVEVKVKASDASLPSINPTTSLVITKGLSDGAKLQDYKNKRDLYLKLAQDTRQSLTERSKYSYLAIQWGEKYSKLVTQMQQAGKGKMAVELLATGGYVSGPGSSTSDSIPARLSNGEYVVRASAVKAYGLDFMNALNQQRIGSAPAMPGSGMRGGGGSGVVYLSSRDRELLQAVIDRPITLRTSNRVIAESANDGNRELARRGKN